VRFAVLNRKSLRRPFPKVCLDVRGERVHDSMGTGMLRASFGLAHLLGKRPAAVLVHHDPPERQLLAFDVDIADPQPDRFVPARADA
jgi:hypothetical protein